MVGTPLRSVSGFRLTGVSVDKLLKFMEEFFAGGSSVLIVVLCNWGVLWLFRGLGVTSSWVSAVGNMFGVVAVSGWFGWGDWRRVCYGFFLVLSLPPLFLVCFLVCVEEIGGNTKRKS